MPRHEDFDRARAERLFKIRELQKADASKATEDYYSAQQALRDRTKELRRLRLAHEAKENYRPSQSTAPTCATRFESPPRRKTARKAR